MSEARELHRQAMNLAEEAAEAREREGAENAQPLFEQALELERTAAEAFERGQGSEPTRSVLYRSAASLALDCEKFQEAERLAAAGLSGHPPLEIASELRDLLEQVHFRGSLKRRGVVLDEREFQVSLLGDAIGSGIADSDQFVPRLMELERLIYRTGERKSGHPFRSRGPRRRKVANQVETFLSVPRAGSFSVTLRIGYPEQPDLPGMGLAETVINEIFECLQLFETQQTEHLRRRIGDDQYYQNFVALAKVIAPDGEAVRKVGFSRLRRGEEREVTLSRTRSEITPIATEAPELETRRKRVTVQGVLKFASRMKEDSPEIRIEDADGKKHYVLVPPELMDDIVRPLWDFQVVVSGWREGRKIRLDDIKQADEESQE